MMVRAAVGAVTLSAALLLSLSASADDTDAAPDSADEQPDITSPMGAAFAPAYYDPDTDVRVAGGDDAAWTLDIGGYIRSGYTHIQADPDYELFGRNDGFVMSDARLTNRGQLDNGLGFVMTLDAGSRLVRTTPGSPVQELAVRMTDTYVYYAPFEDSWLEFNLGQFKAPFDAEDLISASDLRFVNRSVFNRGVQDVEGFNVEGMSQDRQVGLQARGTLPLVEVDGPEGDPQSLAVSYAAAVANGNGPNQSLNENSQLATYGRLVAHWGDVVAIGGAAFYNPRTFGDPPDQIDRDRTGWTADLQVDLFGFSLLTNVVNETRTIPEFDDAQNPETRGLGYQVQLAYEEPFFGLEPAYRFAHYDPNDVDENGETQDEFFENDALTYHTLGLNYNAQDYPIRLMTNYTITVEEEARQIDNDRLDLLLQLQW